MARKTKCTPEVQKAVTDALSMGAPVHLACDYAGITEESYYFWLRRAAKGEKPYLEFSEAIQKAQGRSVVGWLAKIEAAANAGNWQAAAWKLERRYPRDFGRMVQEHVGADGGPVKVEIHVVYDETTPGADEAATA